jgi:hypothetical protein
LRESGSSAIIYIICRYLEWKKDDLPRLTHDMQCPECPVRAQPRYPPYNGLDGSLNGFGLAVDNAGFSVGACTTLVDPGSYPGGAELDDACASDDSTEFPHFLK